nr:fibronectin type III domain-containing protein [Allomuricauda sp.]|tara:strand:+ start:14419 stop:15534 length:1116 start_codon:yes stop_codon:yes gene_type:complete
MKGMFSRGLSLALFFVALSMDAQMDYGTIKLYNALTDQEIQDISDASTYDLNIVGDSLNIVAVPPGSVGSVTFSTTVGESRTESVAPYAFKGDVSGDFMSWLTLPNHLDVPITFTVNYWSAGGGTGSLVGDDVFTITFTKPTPDTTPPSAPSNLASTGNTDTTIEVFWNAASDNVGVTGYKIYLDNSPTTLANVTVHQLTGLTPATSYNIKVRALDAAGNESSDSNTVTVTTDSPSGGGGGSVWSQSGSVASYSGNVAIGTTTVPSGYKMAVEGKIRSREIRVDQDTWPDYVFDKDYQLMTLGEIRKHIEEKGHLPNMPSAKEVQANGVELGEMNNLLLEKIEELTLYILELDKKVETQKEQIKYLESNLK